MQQILLIHGGDAYKNHEDYLQSLREKEITLERIRAKGWKSNLQKALGGDYDVLAPRFPNAQNARYEEWKIIFEKILPLLDDGVILIGHSLGGIFLLKYLSEETVNKKIKATLLLAAPYATEAYDPIITFNIERSFASFRMTAGKIIIYHSRDDVVVPFENAERLKRDLPDAEIKVFEDRGHFNDEIFPEIVEDIKKISSGH
jgi:uncharacterized protein